MAARAKLLLWVAALSLCAFFPQIEGLKILNSSPVPPGRTVLFSLSSFLPGTLSFDCVDLEFKSKRINRLVPPAIAKNNDEQFAVFHAPFSTSTNVTCTVTNGESTEVALTSVLVVDPSQRPFRVRRDVRDITDEQRKVYFDAILELKRTFVYEYFVQAHSAGNGKPARNPGEEDCEREDFAQEEIPCTNSNRSVAHQGPFFPVWHREFLNIFEDALVMVNREEPSLALHFWDWIRDSQVGAQSEIFTAKFYGACDPDELENPGRAGARVIDGPFVVENFPVRTTTHNLFFNEPLRRSPGARGSSLPTVANQNVILCLSAPYDSYPWQSRTPNSWRDVFEGFTNSAGGFHNTVHGFVGGNMVDVAYSPNDPLFWGHHTNLDRVFYAWQIKHPKEVYLPREGDKTAPPLHTSEKNLWPMGRTPDDVWWPVDFTYDMDDLLKVVCE